MNATWDHAVPRLGVVLIGILLHVGFVAEAQTPYQAPVPSPDRSEDQRPRRDPESERTMPQVLAEISRATGDSEARTRRSTNPARVRPTEDGQQYPASMVDGEGEFNYSNEGLAEESSTPPWMELAAEAGHRTAAVIARGHGADEYRRIGAVVGFKTAIEDRVLSEWDYEQGYRLGRHDPDGRHHGAYLGATMAETLAVEAADAAVQSAFRDLINDPQANPNPPRVPEPEIELELEPRPVLEDLLREYASAWQSVDPESIDPALRPLYSDPVRAYQMPSPASKDPPWWLEPESVFSLWVSRGTGTEAYTSLASRADQAVFLRVFGNAYLNQLGWFFDSNLKPAYDQGFDAGWELAASICYEHRYRVGITDGFNATVREAAAESFDRTYAAAYSREYLIAFADWSNNPHPEILYITLRDGNSDAVFEPGERLLVDYGLVNFGGASGQVSLMLSGPDLEADSSFIVQVAARERMAVTDPVTARIRADAEAQTLSLVDLSVNGSHQSADLLVSFPLRFSGEATMHQVDAVSGKVTVEAIVRNQSTKNVQGTVALQPENDLPPTYVADIKDLEAHEAATVVFELDGIDPIRLLTGDLTITLTLYEGDRVVDQLGSRLTDVSTDLNNRELSDFLVHLAKSGGTSRDRVETVHDLIIDRLWTDWKTTVEAPGNLYEIDHTRNSSRTALGNLVHSYEREQPNIVQPELFSGLVPKINSMAPELPGSYPRHRRSFLQLASRLASGR